MRVMERAIKRWFWGKIEKEQYVNLDLDGMHEVVRETEKAYLLSVEGCTCDGEYDVYRKIWVPKSCTLTAEEYEAEQNRIDKAFEDGRKYNERLVAFCKANKIKGARIGLRTATLIKKIEDAGLEVPSKIA